jgi:hypothetical protein
MPYWIFSLFVSNTCQKWVFIIIVCDGDERNHSKLATTKQWRELYNNHIKLNQSNTSLMSLLDKKILQWYWGKRAAWQCY